MGSPYTCPKRNGRAHPLWVPGKSLSGRSSVRVCDLQNLSKQSGVPNIAALTREMLDGECRGVRPLDFSPHGVRSSHAMSVE